MFEERQLFKSKEIKNLHLVILGDLGHSWLITYETSKLNPKRTYVYTKEYLAAYYEEAGSTKWIFE